jgi:hypothetical protein
MEYKLPEDVRNYFRDRNRIRRHGDPTIVLKCGRKPVSEEHKKETKRKYQEKMKLERGNVARGRPKKPSATVPATTEPVPETVPSATEPSLPNF